MQDCLSALDDRGSWAKCIGWSVKKRNARRFIARRLVLAAKKEGFVAFSNAIVIAASTVLVLTTLNVFQSSDVNSSSSVSLWNDGIQFGQLSEANKEVSQELHDSFDIPFRLLEPIPFQGKLGLLDEFRKPISSASEPRRRRAVFGHIHGHTLIERIRALATVVTYARATRRVPIIFWHLYHDGFKDPFSTVLDWSCLMDFQSVIVVDVPDVNAGFSSEKKPEPENAVVDQDSFFHLPADSTASHDKDLVDWTELSIHEIQPDLGAQELSSYSVHSSLEWASRVNEKSHYLLHKSVNDDFSSVVSAMNALAARDAHVIMTISGGVRSRYTPLVASEEAVQTCLVSKSQQSLVAIANAHMTVLRWSGPERTNVERMLHDEFQIPYVLLNGLRPVMKRILLDKLLRKQKQGQFAPRTIWIHVQYGLGNRLRALGSAMAFAKETGRILVLIWVPDPHLNCYFRDLFVEQDEVLVSDSFNPDEPWPFVHAKSRDVAMHAVDWYNFMRVNGVQMRSPSDPVFDVPTRHIYVSTAYVMQSPVTPLIIKTQSVYWRVLRNLTPHIDVARLVDKHSSAFVTAMMGIHIRGKSILTDITGVGSEEYSEESSRRTDYWRNLTRVDSFIEEMQKQNSSQMFYLAADQRDVLLRIESEFPGRVVYTPRQCDSRSKQCLPFALADILLLAKCSSVRGSYWSSFSELSVRWSGVKFLLAGVDFGRPSSNETT